MRTDTTWDGTNIDGRAETSPGERQDLDRGGFPAEFDLSDQALPLFLLNTIDFLSH